VQDWKQLTDEERQEYDKKARLLGISGWNLFLKESFMVSWYEVIIDNTGNPNTLTDYQVPLMIDKDEQFFIDADYRQATIRFYDEDKITLLNHYTWYWGTEVHDATLWVKVPSIPANSVKKIFLKLDKRITKDVSDPIATFEFFDDFKIFDTSKWGKTANATVTIEDGKIKIEATTDSDGIYTLQTFPLNRSVVMRIKWSAHRTGYHAQGFKESQAASPEFADYDAVELSYTLHHDFSYVAANKTTGDLCYTLAPDISSGVFYWLHVDRLSDRARFRLAGISDLIDYADCIPSPDLPIRITPSSAQTTTIDWIYVRKATHPEPSVSYTKL